MSIILDDDITATGSDGNTWISYNVHYVIGYNDTAHPEDGWSADIPTESANDTYYVCYHIISPGSDADNYSGELR